MDLNIGSVMNMRNRINGLAPPTLPMRLVAIALACVWLVIGIREQISPEGYTTIYGLEVAGAAGLSYVRGIGARNIALSTAVIAISALGNRVAMIVLAACLALMSGIEIFIATEAVGVQGGIKYVVITAVLCGITIWYLLFPRKERAQEQ